MFIAERHDSHVNLALFPVWGEEREELVLEHAEGEIRAVDDEVRPFAYRREQIHLLVYGVLDRGAARGERVRAARFLIAPHDGAHVRVHVQDAYAAVHLLELVNGLEQLPEAVLLAHVRHEGDVFIAPAGGDAELGKARHERDGHIVHAVVVQILHHVRGAALARPGQSGDNQKIHLSLPFSSPVSPAPQRRSAPPQARRSRG